MRSILFAMKIVLVFPPFFLESMYNLPPLGLVNLATSFKKTAHEVVIIDFVLSIRKNELKFGRNIYDQCAEIILKETPDLVGFSAQCTTYPSVLQIAKRIKTKKKETINVIGGHNASFVDRLTLEKYPWIDSIVRGEGEITFRELVDAYDKGGYEKGVEGVTYRRKDRVITNKDRKLISDLDQLPLADYSSVLPFSEYKNACNLPRSIAIVEVGRGCPHRCIYCSESILWRRKPRNFSINRLVGEMHNLRDNFGAECFLLAYDQFTAKKDFVKNFCLKLIEEGLNQTPWYCISRLDTVDASLLELMKEAGCESMCYGIDSGSPKTLAFIRKNIDQKDLFQRVKETANQGIIPTLSFVIGFPEEEKEDIDATLLLALKTGILGNVNPLIQMPTILPGTDLAMEYGTRLVRRIDTYFSLGIEFDSGMRLYEDEEMINDDPVIFSSFYNLPCAGYSLEQLNFIASYFPLVVNFYPMTFLLLGIELQDSISGLFFRWLNWIRSLLKKRHFILTPQDFYRHFTGFVNKCFKNKDEIDFKHLNDVLKFETLGLEAGKFDIAPTEFHIDLNQVLLFKPQKSREIVMGRFDFDLPKIKDDLKNGIFIKNYQYSETFLVFKQEEKELEVIQINDFGNELLNLCDGKKNLQYISKLLYHRFGSDLNPDDFFEVCLEATNTLGEIGLLKSGQITE